MGGNIPAGKTEGKRIVIFSDGTGQERFKTQNSNIVKLLNLCVNDSAQGQVTFYDPGLGAGKYRLLEMATGKGIKQNIFDCFRGVVQECNYQPGDEIFLFGFSRGAYTVRALSGWMAMLGIPTEWKESKMQEAWNIYELRAKDPQKAATLASAFKKDCHPDLDKGKFLIRFIGVFDTVKALGLPGKLDILTRGKHSFMNHNLSSIVNTAVQALSLDDDRRTFHPEIWDESQKMPGQTIEQVWFAGVHSDIGGSYVPLGLGNITLTWMLHHANDAGLKIKANHSVPLSPKLDVDGAIHDCQKGWAECFRDKQREWRFNISGKKPNFPPKIYQSVVDRQQTTDNKPGKYASWILAENPVVVNYLSGDTPFP